MDKKKLNWFLSGGASFTPSTEYQAVLNRTTALGGALPSTAIQQIDDILMRALVSGGILSEHKALYFPMTGDAALSAYGRVNWANPGTFDLTPQSTATYGKKGWSKGASNGYLDTGFIPNTHGGSVFQQDNAAVWGHRVESTITAGVFGGCSDASFTKRTMLAPRFTGNLNYYSVNGAAKNIATNRGNGMIVAKRTGASAFDCRRNDTALDSATTASTGRSSFSFTWLCENGAGTPQFFDDGTFAAGGLSSAMTTQKWTDLFTAYVTRNISLANLITIPAYTVNVDNFSTWKSAVQDYAAFATTQEYLVQTMSVSGSTLTGTAISEFSCLDESGWMWAGAHDATYIYRVNTSTGEVQIPITGLPVTARKHVGGVYVYETKEIHLPPYNSGGVGIIDTVNLTYTLVTDPSLSGTNMWAGWSRGKNGKLYGANFDATWILVWDPITRTISQLSNCPPGTFSGTSQYVGNCWTGGSEIHFALHSATAFMYVDTDLNTYTTWGSSVAGATKYSDISYDPITSMCYMWPYQNQNIRSINPATKTDNGTIGSLLGVVSEGANRFMDGKWAIYPLDFSRVQIFDPQAGTVYNLEPPLAAGNKFCGGSMGVKGALVPAAFSNTTVYEIGQRQPVNIPYNYLNHPSVQSF